VVQGNLGQLTATVTPAATGVVEFRYGNLIIATVTVPAADGDTSTWSAEVSTAGVPLGTYVLQAIYLGGDGVHAASPLSPPVAVNVIPQDSVAREKPREGTR
jgi:hypothetical protein